MKNVVRCLLMAFVLYIRPSVAEPVITITTEQWPPNNYLDENGEVVGKATDKVRQLMRLAGVPYRIELMPWARAYHKALNNPNTGVYSIMRSQSREKLFQWVCPLIAPTPIFVYKLAKRDDISVKSLADMRKYIISVSKNEFDHQFLEANGFIAEKDFYVSFDDRILVRKLLNGRIDIMIGTEYALINYAEKLGFEANVVKKEMEIPIPAQNPTCLAFSLSTPKETVEKVRKALRNAL